MYAMNFYFTNRLAHKAPVKQANLYSDHCFSGNWKYKVHYKRLKSESFHIFKAGKKPLRDLLFRVTTSSHTEQVFNNEKSLKVQNLFKQEVIDE